MLVIDALTVASGIMQLRSGWVALGLVALGCSGRSTLPIERTCFDDCKGADCQVRHEFTAGRSESADVALDADYVYWTEGIYGQEGGVFKASRCDGSATVLSTAPLFPSGIVVDDEAIFWGNVGVDPPAGIGGLMRSGLDGENPALLAEGVVLALAVDQSHVYWAAGGRVQRTPRAGGPTTELWNAGVQGAIHALAVDDTHVYTTHRGGTVSRVSKSAGEASVLAEGQADPRDLEVDEQAVYWVDFHTQGNDGAIRSVPKDGGPVTTVALGQQMIGTKIAIDDQYVYFVAGELLRVPKSGGTPNLLVPDLYNVQGIAVDDVGVYWSRWQVGKLFRER